MTALPQSQACFRYLVIRDDPFGHDPFLLRRFCLREFLDLAQAVLEIQPRHPPDNIFLERLEHAILDPRPNVAPERAFNDARHVTDVDGAAAFVHPVELLFKDVTHTPVLLPRWHEIFSQLFHVLCCVHMYVKSI